MASAHHFVILEMQVEKSTAYQSDSKIVVGDFPDELRRANPELKFVSKQAFSQPNPSQITMRQVEQVLEGRSNLKNDLFAVFETPIELIVSPNTSSTLLAKYLAHFYDDKMVIQDKFFVSNHKNETNFTSYVLPHRDGTRGEILLRVMVNQELAKKGSAIKGKHESNKDYNIKVQCIQETRENLHDGYIESSKYRIRIGYRLFVFGENGRTIKDQININRK